MQQPTISRSTSRSAVDTTNRHQNQDLDTSIVLSYLPKPSSSVWVIRDQDGVQYAGRQGTDAFLPHLPAKNTLLWMVYYIIHLFETNKLFFFESSKLLLIFRKKYIISVLVQI